MTYIPSQVGTRWYHTYGVHEKRRARKKLTARIRACKRFLEKPKPMREEIRRAYASGWNYRDYDNYYDVFLIIEARRKRKLKKGNALSLHLYLAGYPLKEKP
jgi:hypothetical protein